MEFLTVSEMSGRRVALRHRLEHGAQAASLLRQLPGEAHAGQRDGLLPAGDRVELALLEVVGHAGDVGELPLVHGTESCAEAPHLGKKDRP